MKAQFIYEKFEKDSDPIRDMGIGAFPEDFTPMYILKKQYPGMVEYAVGSVFGRKRGWDFLFVCWIDDKERLRSAGSTVWMDETYFKPFIGEFFEKYK